MTEYESVKSYIKVHATKQEKIIVEMKNKIDDYLLRATQINDGLTRLKGVLKDMDQMQKKEDEMLLGRI